MIQKTDIKLISTKVRPPRNVIFLNENAPYGKDSLIRILERSSKYWGGAHSVIVPTDGKTIREEFWKILLNFKPDFLFVYQQSFRDFKRADPDAFERMVRKSTEEQLSKADRNDVENMYEMILESYLDSPFSVEHFNLDANLVNELINKLNPFYYNIEHSIQNHGYQHHNTEIKHIISNFPRENQTIDDFNLDVGSKDIELLFRSYLGGSAYIQETKDDYNARDILNGEVPNEINFNIRDINIDNINELIKLLIDNKVNTPFNIISRGLLGYIPRRSAETDKKIVIVVGESIIDFCFYLSLKNIFSSVIWMPSILLENPSDKMNFQIQHWLIDKISNFRKHWFIGNEIVVTSFSTDESVLKKIDTIIAHRSYIISSMELSYLKPSETLSNFRNPMFVCEELDRKNNHVEQFINNKSVNYLNAPVPKTFQKINAYDYKWITDFTILTASHSTNPKEGYTLPPKPIFSKDIFPEDNLYNNNATVRFTGECLSFVCPNMGLVDSPNIESQTISPRLGLLEPYEIFTRLFQSIGFDVEISDKGNYTRECINFFGSIEYLGLCLTDEKRNNIFEEFACQLGSGERQKQGRRGIFVRERTYLNFSDIEHLIGDKVQASYLIDDFIFRGLFYRGFALWCRNCKNADWYAFGEIDENFVCSRCNKKQIISVQNWKEPYDEPDIYYKLNEIFYQGYINNMKYPVLTLNRLKKDAFDSYIYSPELVLFKEGDKKEKIEIDVACISDGELIIGEVKENNETPKKLNIYNKIVNLLNARFVYSTYAEQISESTISKIEEFSWNKSPLYFVKKDLLKLTDN